jgi:hypothetical protein
MTITITLTSAGSDSGPFDLYTNATGSFTLMESGVSKSTLLAGYTVTTLDGTTLVRVQSTGECTNYQDIPVGLTTTTIAPTTTVAPPSFKSVYITNSSTSGNVTVYNVEVDGIVLIEDTGNFPLTAGQNLTGLAYNNSSTASVFISFTTPTDSAINITDSYGNSYCVTSPGSETVTIDFSGPGAVSINVGEQGSACF